MKGTEMNPGGGFSLESYVERRLRDRKILLMTHIIAGYHPNQDDEGFPDTPKEQLKREAFDINRYMIRRMIEADVDIVELQEAFSEPIADGSTFVAANHGAIANGVTPSDYFRLMGEFSECGVPLIAMGYYNWPYQLGHAEFARSLYEAGGSGYIMADLPPEVDDELRAACAEFGLNPILLMTPTNSRTRMKEIAQRSSGFVYCQARRGVTGRGTRIDEETKSFIDECTDATEGRLPLGLGFGIDTAEKVRALHGRVAIAIVGTALMRAWQTGGEKEFDRVLDQLAGARW